MDGSKGIPLISCLCFSKDRPLQLDGYIESLLASCPAGALDLAILHKSSSEGFEKAYGEIQALRPEARFIKENGFKDGVKAWLAEVKSPFVMFGCDDVVFKEPFDVLAIARAFDENLELAAFSLRLGLEISYCATMGCTQAVPELLRKEPFLLWNWRKAEVDWGYPFELDCSVYRREFVEQLLLTLGEICPAWINPNRLEDFGVKTVKQMLTGCQLMASFPTAKAVVPTVNRVQDEYRNSVYDPNSELTSEKLLYFWNDGARLDVEAYKSRIYHSVHVGDLFLKKGSSRFAATEYDEAKEIILAFARGAGGRNAPFIKHPALPSFIVDFDKYFHTPGAETERPVEIMPCLDDRLQTTHVDKIYFHQDSWAFSRALAAKPSKIVDIGSTALLVGIMSYLAPTESIDIRPLPVNLPGLTCKRGSILELPYPDKSVEFLTSVCVVEHIGLGRYGDPLDPEGSVKALREIARVIAPGGHFIGSVPAAAESFVCFNAHRVFTRQEILSLLPGFEIASEQFLHYEPVPMETMDKLFHFDYGVWCFDLVRKG